MSWTPSLPTSPLETPTGGGNVASLATGEEFITQLDMYSPDELSTTIFARHKNAMGFRFQLEAAGKSQGVSQPTVSHYESGQDADLVKVASTSGAGAGVDVDVTLHADNMYTVTGLGVSSYPREKDVILFEDGKKGWVKTKDTSGNPHVLTVTPFKAAENLATSITNGSSYAIIGNAWGEGTSLPSTVHPRYWKYTSEFQIVKEAMAYTGSALSNSIRLTAAKNSVGGTYLVEILDDTFIRYEISSDRVLLFAESIDNVTMTSNILNASVNVKGTTGLDTFAQLYGHDYTYTVGSWAIGDFSDLAKIYEDERTGTSNIHGMLGYDLFVELEDAGTAWLSQDGNASVFTRAVQTMYNSGLADRIDMDADTAYGFGLDIGFQAIRKAGYTFSWQKVAEFNNRTGVGTTAYDYPNRVIFCPIGQVGQMDGAGNKSVAPTIYYNYKKAGNYSRQRQIGIVNGVGSQSLTAGGISGMLRSNANDGSQLGIVSEINFHMTLPNAIIYGQPA